MRAISLPALGLVLVSLVLTGTVASARQGLDDHRIRVFVFCAETRAAEATHLNLPAAERELEPMHFGPEGNNYVCAAKEANRQVELLNRQLQRTGSRRDITHRSPAFRGRSAGPSHGGAAAHRVSVNRQKPIR